MEKCVAIVGITYSDSNSTKKVKYLTAVEVGVVVSLFGIMQLKLLIFC